MQAGLTALLVLGGCIETDDITVEAPAEIRWAVVIEEGIEPSVSDLLPWRPGDGLGVFSNEGASLLVLGFIDVPTPPASAPLALAGPCEPSLGRPAWVARVFDGSVTSLSPASAPRVTGDWLPGAGCDSAPGPIVADVGCAFDPCRATGTIDDACRVQLDLRECGGGMAAGRVNDGELCLDLSRTPWSCEPATTASGALASFDCDGCTVHIDPAPGEAPFTIDRIAIAPGPVVLPAHLATEPRFEADSLLASRLLDLVVLDDRIIVTSNDQDTGVFCGSLPGHDTIMTSVDPVTLQTSTTSSGVPCLMRLAADPQRPGFYGVHGDQGQWRIGRFDPDGRRTADAPIEPRSQASLPPGTVTASITQHWVVSLDAMGAPGQAPVLVSVFQWRREARINGTLLYRHEPSVLALLGSRTLELRETWHVERHNAELLVAGGQQLRALHWVEAATGQLHASVPLPMLPTEPTQDITAVAVHPPTGRVAALISWERPAIRILDFDGLVADTRFFDRTIVPTRAIALHDGRSLLVTGLEQGTDGQWRAVAGIVDAVEGRMLPGVWPLADGAITALKIDGAGRVWALAAWSGELLRLTLR